MTAENTIFNVQTLFDTDALFLSLSFVLINDINHDKNYVPGAAIDPEFQNEFTTAGQSIDFCTGHTTTPRAFKFSQIATQFFIE